MRETGYYFVKMDGFWRVGKWFSHMNGFWRLVASLEDHFDSEFEEINENRILNPDEQSS